MGTVTSYQWLRLPPAPGDSVHFHGHESNIFPNSVYLLFVYFNFLQLNIVNKLEICYLLIITG